MDNHTHQTYGNTNSTQLPHIYPGPMQTPYRQAMVPGNQQYFPTQAPPVSQVAGSTTTTSTYQQATTSSSQSYAPSYALTPQQSCSAATQDRNQRHSYSPAPPQVYQNGPLPNAHTTYQQQAQLNTQIDNTMSEPKQPADFTQLMKATPGQNPPPVNDFTHLMQAAPLVDESSNSTTTTTTTKVESYIGADAGGQARKAAEAKGDKELKVFEEKVQTLFRSVKVCPMNWPWYNMEDGYLYAEGIHFLHHKDIDMAFKLPGWRPEVMLVNTWHDPSSQVSGTYHPLHPPPIDYFQPMHRAHKLFIQQAKTIGVYNTTRGKGMDSSGCVAAACLDGIEECTNEETDRRLRAEGYTPGASRHFLF